jgi:hypothetical protein
MKNKLSRPQKIWLLANVLFLGLAIYSLGSDVWEAYFFLFFISVLAQGYSLWRKR